MFLTTVRKRLIWVHHVIDRKGFCQRTRVFETIIVYLIILLWSEYMTVMRAIGVNSRQWKTIFMPMKLMCMTFKNPQAVKVRKPKQTLLEATYNTGKFTKHIFSLLLI